MKLIIENIGTITSVAVELGNMTVIAGENDVGKSTVGRVFFALVQAFSNYPVALKKMQDDKIRRTLEQARIEVRKYVDFSAHPEFRNLFSPHRLMDTDTLDETVNQLRLKLEQFERAGDFPSYVMHRIHSRLETLYKEVHEEVSENGAIANAIFKALRSEFSGEIINKEKLNNAKILLIDGATTILEIVFNETEVLNFKGGDQLGINDATLVEGPAILQYRNALNSFNEVGEPRFFSGSIPFHSIDLARKLQNIRPDPYASASQPAIIFEKLYDGKMQYDAKAQDFLLDRKHYKISSNNTATGIKAMAILELLIQGDYIREDTILILDEPETSLHPKWQIAYAKIICKLAEFGAKILVTTHSPYMLEALKAYSSKPVDAKFYLAQKNESNLIRYIDTSGDITPIISALSQPLEDLIENISHDF